jgi:putative SOS response-associated peptidase YedK
MNWAHPGKSYNAPMCGRFVTPGQSDVERLWHVRGTEGLFSQSYNVAPTTKIPMVFVDRDDGSRRLAVARWGLVPFWAKGPKPPSHTFNARLEEAPGKAMWKKPFREARCIIPALGWYEWKEQEVVDAATGEVRKYKQPYFMHLPGTTPIGFAGLMAWTKVEGSGEWTGSCTILTTAASGIAAEVHHRMPVALAEAAHDAWLDRMLVDPEQVNALIAGNQLASAIEKHPVSTRVNGSRIDDASLLNLVNPE